MVTRSALAGLAFVLAGTASAPASATPRLRGVAIPVSPALASTPEPDASGAPAILYLNRCANGCTVTPGDDDSRNNRSSIVPSTTTIPAYPWGDASWNELMTCVRQLYAPFNIQVTDVDPGNTPHFEHMVGGLPAALGLDPDVGGVAPLACDVIPNAVTYTFAAAWGGDVTGMCYAVGQETAHAYGLDHLLDCRDPMTYLPACGHKAYQDTEAQCGEDSPRTCKCGGTHQNSFQWIMDRFGPSGLRPDVHISEPADGALVSPSFFVRVDVGQSGPAVTRLALQVDGSQVGELYNPPFVFNSPPDLARGSHRIEVVAYSEGLDPATTRVDVTVHHPCADGCTAGEVCIDASCVPGPDMAGGLGDACDSSADCLSGSCGTAGGASYCTETCDPAADGCPADFACVAAGEHGGVCWPSAGDGGGLHGGGCDLLGSPARRTFGHLGGLLVVLALIGLGTRKRAPRRR